jgi:outer membrane protein assembly factor BamB
MRISKPTYPKIAIIWALLLISSPFMVFSNSANSTVDASTAHANVDVAGDYCDLLQYEWPQIHGDPAFTRFSAGPAPDAPDILWKKTVNDIQSYVAAFNGKVFVTTMTNVIALDKDTGSIVWNTTLTDPERWPAVYKIDDTHLVIGKYCLDIETGEVFWKSDEFSASTTYFSPGVYSPEEKVFYSKGKSLVRAWNFSDPSKPPALAWEAYVPGGGSVGSGVHYGDGKVFPGSYDAHQMALDAKTGTVIWDTLTTGAMMFCGSYYQGKFLRGGMDNQFYCFDVNTSKVLWVFNPGTEFGHWCGGCAAAYGKVYQVNKDGHLYAIDVNSGQPVWKYKGPSYIFFPGWPVVADGKVYATTGQAVSSDPYTGEYSKSEFVCLDAYTGRLLWKLPIEAHAPRESVAIAYGNLYLIPGSIKEDEMDSYETLDEVWALGTKPWPMWRSDPEHTGVGQSGPANLTLRWNFTAGGAVISSPSVVDGKVYVGSNDRNIHCLDALSGSPIWNFTTGFGIKSSPAVVDGKVYVGPDDGTVYCLDAKNGSLIWETPAGGYVQAHFDAVARLRSSPTVVEGKVYVGSLDTNVYCLDAKNGSVIWTYKTAGYITSSPAVVDGAVYITSQEPTSGVLYKLDAKNGSRVWKLEMPYQLTAERGTDMHSSPTVSEGMVFTSSNKLERYGVNATTGEIEWTYRNVADEFIVDSMSYHNGKLFFVDLSFVVCVDAKSSQPLWKTYLGEVLESSPTYADGKLYVAGSDRRAIYVLNATTGDKLSWFGTGSKCWSSPALYEGRLYVGNHDWNVYCLVDASFPIIPTSIVANLSKDTIDRAKGESVTVTGQIKPGIAGVFITVTFVKPDGSSVERVVTASEDGSFIVSRTLDTVGNWTVTAWFSGAEYPSHAYTCSYSTNLPLTVVESQKPPPEEGTSREYVYAGAAILVMVMVVIAGYTYIKRGKK